MTIIVAIYSDKKSGYTQWQESGYTQWQEEWLYTDIICQWRMMDSHGSKFSTGCKDTILKVTQGFKNTSFRLCAILSSSRMAQEIAAK